jgi:hypothetical protein
MEAPTLYLIIQIPDRGQSPFLVGTENDLEEACNKADELHTSAVVMEAKQTYICDTPSMHIDGQVPFGFTDFKFKYRIMYKVTIDRKTDVYFSY